MIPEIEIIAKVGFEDQITCSLQSDPNYLARLTVSHSLRLEDKTAVNPQEAILDHNLAENTRRVLSTLLPREEQVLKMRFGIGEKSNHTLEEVGNDFDVTRERIRQIEAKALRKLRHPSRSRMLEGFIAGDE